MARLDEKEFAAAARRANEVYDVQEEPAARDPGDASAKRRRKKKGKKKHPSNATSIDQPTGSRLPPVRGVTGFTDSYIATGQTDPPSIPIRQLFAAENAYPEGEKQDYAEDFVLQRSSQAELRAQMRDDEDFMLRSLRQAAEVHRHVRKFAQSLMKPGVSLFELCCRLEDKNRELVEEAGPQRGIAFPTGCSLNHVAAHYTPNTVADKTVLSYDDVMKLDIGTHVNGYTVDSAFTVAFNPQYDELLEAVKAATNEGVRSAGVDVQLGELGGAIQEVMESYEVTINGKTYPVKAIRNLCGHTIEKGLVHGGKSVSSIKTGSTVKMEEGEIYAIETFGSTGRGYVDSDGECSHYARNMEAAHVPIESARTKKLLAHLTRTFGSMPFCRRWLELPSGGSAFVNPKGAKQERYLMALRELVNKGIVNAYPPLVDIRGSYTAQYEHTLVLRSMGKEVMSRGDDY